MSRILSLKNAFAEVGWFVPAFVSIGFLNQIKAEIEAKGAAYTQQDLERMLAIVYSADSQAAMVLHRYPVVPYLKDFKTIIAESIEAHFNGLDHVAVAGLMPVIEGAAGSLAKERSITVGAVKSVFEALAEDCKREAEEKNLGLVSEVVVMLDSFSDFAVKHLYINSNDYMLSDKTNRHGILHGAFSDTDYGTPINFYKSIAAVEFLSFISSFRANISWMAPDPTDASRKLGAYYQISSIFAQTNPRKL